MADRDVRIRYSADVSGLVRGTDRAAAANQRLERSFQGVNRESSGARDGLNRVGQGGRNAEQGLSRSEQAARRSRDELGRFRRDSDDAGDSARRAGENADSASGGFRALAAAGGAIAGAAIVGSLQDCVRAASDLEQTMNKSSVIWGENAGEIEAWASTAAESMGLSKEAALSSAAGFGDMFLQLGIGAGEAQKMSTGIVQLAADLGSFNNVPTAAAVDMISAAMRGEYDSLQALIPNINAARVEQEALAMTGKSTASELTAAEKATATYAIIQKDGARASGDFARSSGTLAVEQQKLAAKVEDTKAAIGTSLLPILSAVVGAVGSVVEPFGKFVGVLNDMPGPAKAAAGALAALTALRVTGISSAISGGFNTMRTSMIRFRGAAEQAGGGMDGLRAGFRNFNHGAGVAGTALNGLRTAGSSALGLFGGPWGVAMIGATALLATFAENSQRGERAQASFADALKASAGKIDSTVKQDMLKSLQEAMSPSRWDQYSRSAGITMDQIVDAYAKGGQAAADMEGKIRAAGRSTSDFGTMGVANKILPIVKGWQNATAAAGQAKTATDKLGGSMKNVGIDAETTAGFLESMGARSEEAKKQIDALTGALDLMGGGQRAVRAATRELNDSIAEMSKTMKDGASTAQQRQAATDKIAESTMKLVDAQMKEGATADEVAGTYNRGRKAIIDAANARGIHGAAAEAEADKIVGTRDQFMKLIGAYMGAPKKVVTKVETPGADLGKAAFGDLKKAANAVPKGVSTRVDVPGAVVAGAQLGRVTAAANTIPRGRSTAVSTPGIAGAINNINTLRGRISAVPGRKDTSVNVHTNAGNLGGILGMLNSLHDRTITVTTVSRQVGSFFAYADGGIQINGARMMAHGGIRPMANGDTLRNGAIMRSMQPILWNEMPGGEAYIPLRASVRPRAIDLWRKTGALLGVLPAANGHIHPTTTIAASSGVDPALITELIATLRALPPAVEAGAANGGSRLRDRDNQRLSLRI